MSNTLQNRHHDQSFNLIGDDEQHAKTVKEIFTLNALEIKLLKESAQFSQWGFVIGIISLLIAIASLVFAIISVFI